MVWAETSIEKEINKMERKLLKISLVEVCMLSSFDISANVVKEWLQNAATQRVHILLKFW
jgi:hypothetical protein